MSYKFNPLTGKLDYVSSGSGGGSFSGDIHSGIDHILAVETVTIAERKQMVIFDTLTIEGNLIIDGTLVLRN